MPSLEHPPALAPPRRRVPLWRQWLTAAVDLVFPPFCPVCAVRLSAGRRDPLCGGCWERLERIAPPCCRLCGAPVGGAPVEGYAGPDAGRCGDCQGRRPPWAYARAAVRYGEVARDAIHAFKFGGRRAMAGPLAALVADLGPALPLGAVDVIVPVPLHPRRERERGFNQSWLLARRLADAWSLTARGDVLTRRVATAPQTDLGAAWWTMCSPPARPSANARWRFAPAARPRWASSRWPAPADPAPLPRLAPPRRRPI
jgi:predicted amidophosphoribosyltransferase